MRAVGIVLITLLFGCSGTKEEPTQVVKEFLNSVHSGNLKEAETYVDGIDSSEVMDLLKELWGKNPSSFTKNPNYSLSVISNDGKTAIVNVTDTLNNMNFELKWDESWKIKFQTCGVVDLVRGNARDPESYSDDYILEIGDFEEENISDDLKLILNKLKTSGTQSLSDSDLLKLFSSFNAGKLSKLVFDAEVIHPNITDNLKRASTSIKDKVGYENTIKSWRDNSEKGWGRYPNGVPDELQEFYREYHIKMVSELRNQIRINNKKLWGEIASTKTMD